MGVRRGGPRRARRLGAVGPGPDDGRRAALPDRGRRASSTTTPSTPSRRTCATPPAASRSSPRRLRPSVSSRRTRRISSTVRTAGTACTASGSRSCSLRPWRSAASASLERGWCSSRCHSSDWCGRSPVSFFGRRRDRLVATLPLCVSLPFLPGVAQIYPDLLGGGLCLLGLFALFHVVRGSTSKGFAVAVAATGSAAMAASVGSRSRRRSW